MSFCMLLISSLIFRIIIIMDRRIIHCPNSTFNLVIECATFTSLEYNQDEEAWTCVYSDWAYGLFAICSIVMIFLPFLLIIYCCVKACHRNHKDGYKKIHSYSSTRSNSVYPGSCRDLPCLPAEVSN